MVLRSHSCFPLLRPPISMLFLLALFPNYPAALEDAKQQAHDDNSARLL